MEQELKITVVGVSSTARTNVDPIFPFQVFDPATKTFVGSLGLIGSGTFTRLIRFNGSSTPGTFPGSVTIAGPCLNAKTVPLKAVVLPLPTPVVNSTSLSGFTAVQGSAAQGITYASVGVI